MGKQSPSDPEIIALLTNEDGHKLAFGLIMEKYQSRLYWHVRKMVLSHDDADDIIQEAMIKVWQNLPSFRGDASLFTWLYRIVTNETLTFIKRKKRKQAFSIDEEEINWNNYLESDPLFDGNELEIKLHASIQKLPEKQRLVFQMKYFEEMKYEEMSQVLKVSVGSLKASFHHASKKIESFFKDEAL